MSTTVPDLLIRSPRHVGTEPWSDDLTVVGGLITQGHHVKRPITVDARELFLMPGLVDSHTHLVTSPSLGVQGYDDAVTGPTSLIRQRVRDHLREHLRSGVTLIRDAGSPRSDLRELAGSGSAYPLLQTSGRFIAPPRRHGLNLAREVTSEQLEEAALESAAAGSEWVKLIVDHPDREDPDSDPAAEWSESAMTAAVDGVHEFGVRVVAHAMTSEGARLALAAGVDSLEHGSKASDADLRLMAERGIAWTPTLAPFQRLLERIHAGEPLFPRRFMEEAVESTEALVPLAERCGVRMLCGTDGLLGHGEVATEARALVAAGASVGYALEAVSAGAWRFLYDIDPLSEGSPANFILLDDDPRVNLRALEDPVLVVRDGHIVKADGKVLSSAREV